MYIQMPAKNRPLMLRLEPKQHELWLAAADGENIKLSEWIRRACDAALAAGEQPSAAGARSRDEGSMATPLDGSRPSGGLEAQARSAPAARAAKKESPASRWPLREFKECTHARNHRPGAFCKFCFKSY